MYPFVISELTDNTWAFYENGEVRLPYVTADKISILTQKDISDGSSVENWLSVWTTWSSWNADCGSGKSGINFGSKLPTRTRKCQSTSNLYCISAAEENNWIQRKKCSSSCGHLKEKDENCINMPDKNDDNKSKSLKTKCISSLTNPTAGNHDCGPKGMKLPVPMTKTQLQAWLRGYDKCDFEFHSDKAKLPVGLSLENDQLISLIDGAYAQHNFNLNTTLDDGWKKGITGCYNIFKKSTAGRNEKECGQDGYCCSGSGKNNGQDRNDAGQACPSDAIEFIDDNNLQSRHHCLRQGIYHICFRFSYS